MKLRIVKLVTNMIALAWSVSYSYSLLKFIAGDRLLWFLFWGSVPLAFAISIINALVEEEFNELDIGDAIGIIREEIDERLKLGDG